MKKKNVLTAVFLIICLIPLMSQSPPFPPNHGDGGDVVGKAVPLGNGIVWMVLMVTAYIGLKIKKIINNRTE